VSTGTTYTTTFGYDWAKRPASVASPSVFSGSATTTYRLDGLLATRSTPNGETLTLAYDAARRPVTATLAAGNTISQTYDRLGNVTTEGRSFSGISGDPGSGTNTFSYDPLRRLTAETGLSSSRSYQYDLDGNRTRKVEGATTIDYTYDRTDQLINQVIAGLGTAFSYDPYGNLTQAGNSVSAVTTYTFDTASHLTAINAPGTPQDVALTLDALGRFATRTVNGGTDTYGYLGSSETVTTIVGATSTRVSALGADGSRVATKDGSMTGYLLPDLHGNVVAAEASASTTISNALRYDGYGQTLGAYTGSGPIAMDAKYQGRLDLSATTDPLYDMAARFYAPGSGTFTQLDSVLGSAQNPLSMNRFLYAEANPTTFIDPTGHKATKCDGGCGSGSKEQIENAKQAAKQHYEAAIAKLDNTTTGSATKPDSSGPDMGGIGEILQGIWDSGSNMVINTVTGTYGLLSCGGVNAFNPVTCAQFDDNVRTLTDADFRNQKVQDQIFALANGFGDANRNLTSGDPYLTSRAVTDVFLVLGLAGAGRVGGGATSAGVAEAGAAGGSALTRLRFGASDLVYGPTAEGRLDALRDAAGGKTLWQLVPAEGVKDWNALSIEKMGLARESGARIHFDLTNVDNLPGVLDGSSPLAFTCTGQELWYLRENWSRFEGSVTFYSDVSDTDGVVT